MLTTTTLVAIGVLVVGGVALLRGVDVRLVLALSGLALFGVAGKWSSFVTEFTTEMVNPRTVVPICSAWGFARILKLTECDQHLVHLLLRPLRAARWLLVPGGVAVCFVVNTAVVSQTGTASIVGPLLVPLLLASGFGRVTAGAVLLMGSSMGGELFNPGAVELATLAPLVKMTPQEVVGRVMPFNLVACTAALLAFWAGVVWRPEPVERDEPRSSPGPCDGDTELTAASKVNVVKALVPLLPIVILFALPVARRH